MPHKKNKPSPQKHALPQTNTQYYQNLLLNNNIQAYLLTIRKGEGTLGANGYYKHFGGGLLPRLDVRPAHHIYKSVSKKGTIYSSAVGAFQFLNDDKRQYWDEEADKFGWNDILPAHQDIAALDQIKGKKAIEDIINGDIVSAIKKTAGVWASLPGAKYNQPTQKLTDALSFYKDHGGVLNSSNEQLLDNTPGTIKHSKPKKRSHDTSLQPRPVNKLNNDSSITGESMRSTLRINLNTPMIGHFTVSSEETGQTDIRQGIEEVLLEILNSANAIQ